MQQAYELLYDAVALAMWAGTRARFRAEILGGTRDCVEPGVMLLSSHRSNADVPLVCTALYLRGRGWRHRGLRVHFAARDDMFEPGFFAGLVDGMPLPLRRLAFPIAIGETLPRVHVHPLSSAHRLKLVQAFRMIPPETPLEPPLVPASVAALFKERARELSTSPPGTVGRALRPEYVDLLWRPFNTEELGGPASDGLLSRRAVQAAGRFRTLVELVRSGKPLLLFPEGTPSPDGRVGPLRPGLGALVRRGCPRALQPLGVTYDPFAHRRTRAYVSFAPRLATPEREVEKRVLAALRRAMPLVCGPLVAHELLEAARVFRTLPLAALEETLDGALRRALEEGRNVERELLDDRRRHRRLDECLAALARLGLLRRPARGALVLERGRILASPALRRAAAEYASANGFEPARGG